jgi:hypothetical protein
MAQEDSANIKFEVIDAKNKRQLRLEFNVLSVAPPEEEIPVREFYEAILEKIAILGLDVNLCSIEFNVNTYNETYSCVICGERIETDNEYLERIGLEESQRIRREKLRIAWEQKEIKTVEEEEMKEYLRLKAKYETK